MTHIHKNDPLQPHAHEPNFEPPTEDPTIRVEWGTEDFHLLGLAELQGFPPTTVENCFIVSTGHGTSGPFAFTGAQLLDVVRRFAGDVWSSVEVISADGFGNRVMAEELWQPSVAGPILLAYAANGRFLTRQQGLVRLIVPSERDDALRQVKWISVLRIRP